MKKILILMVLISTSMLSAHAQEFDNTQTVTTKHLVGLESSINVLKDEVQEVKYTEFSPEDGKIVASMLVVVEGKIKKAEKLLMAIEDDLSLTMENINAVKKEIEAADMILKEI